MAVVLEQSQVTLQKYETTRPKELTEKTEKFEGPAPNQNVLKSKNVIKEGPLEINLR